MSGARFTTPGFTKPVSPNDIKQRYQNSHPK
jgi:hypothetical protein